MDWLYHAANHPLLAMKYSYPNSIFMVNKEVPINTRINEPGAGAGLELRI